MRLLELEHLWRPEGWLSPAFVAIDDGGAIASVAAQGRATESVRGWVLPGMPNVHSHAFQRAMAGLAEHAAGPDDSFWTWRNVMYDFVERLGPEDVEDVAAQLFVEMLQAGYTSVGEFHYLHKATDGTPYADPAELALRIAHAAERAGIGLTLLPVLYQSSGFGGAPPTAGQRRFLLGVDELFEIVERVRPHAAVGIAPHSLRAVPPDALADALALASADMPIHIHASEQTREVDDCIAWSGRRPVEWLLEHAALDERWCLVHATHVTAAELDGIAASGAVIGLCPTTEANLGDGLFPLPELLRRKGRFGIGSDSHVSVSVVEELRWLEYGQRLALLRRNIASDASELYAAALDGGARALGRPVGALEPGRRADLVVLDPNHPALVERPLERVLDALVFATSSPAVRDVMVGGRWVVRDGKHLHADSIRDAYRAALRRMA